jgi:hypothetical protein
MSSTATLRQPRIHSGLRCGLPRGRIAEAVGCFAHAYDAFAGGARVILPTQAEVGQVVFFRGRRQTAVMSETHCKNTHTQERGDEDNQFHESGGVRLVWGVSMGLHGCCTGD